MAYMDFLSLLHKERHYNKLHHLFSPYSIFSLVKDHNYTLDHPTVFMCFKALWTHKFIIPTYSYLQALMSSHLYQFPWIPLHLWEQKTHLTNTCISSIVLLFNLAQILDLCHWMWPRCSFKKFWTLKPRWHVNNLNFFLSKHCQEQKQEKLIQT